MLAVVLHSGKFPYDKQCPGNTCRRQCRGEDKGSHPVDEILAYRPAAGDVCTGRRSRLAEGAHEEIYIPDTSGFFGAAQAAQSPYAECMGFVHIEQYVGVSFFQTHQCREVGLVTVHAEDAFGDDDDLAKGGVVLFEQSFQLCQIVVTVADAFGGRQADAVNQAGMDELVGKYQRLCIAYGGQDARVGMIPAVEHTSAASVPKRRASSASSSS